MKHIIYILLFFSVLTVEAQKFRIEGKALATDSQVTLKYFSPEDFKYRTLETIELDDSKSFSFSRKFKAANLYELSFDQKHKVLLSVEGRETIQVIRSESGTSIKGSPSSLKMIEFEKQNGQLQQKHFGALKKAADEAMKANDREKLNEIQAQSKVAIQNFLVEFRQLLVDMGTTPAAYHALQFSDFNKEMAFIEERLAVFQEESPDAITTIALERQVNQAKVTGVGKVPPAIETMDKDNNPVSLEQLKGKIVLVDFWAAWCRACRIENPKFAALHQQYNAKGFEILSISQDDTAEAWEKAIAKDGVEDWRHIWDKDKSITNLYSVSSLPQNVVLDPKGVIIAKNVSAEQLEALLLDRL